MIVYLGHSFHSVCFKKTDILAQCSSRLDCASGICSVVIVAFLILEMCCIITISSYFELILSMEVHE
jgi:hypothetical protein